MPRPLRLLTFGHSYCVGVNRALAHAMTAIGGRHWHVEAAAPRYFANRGDLRPSILQVDPTEPTPVTALTAYNTGRVHLFLYGKMLKTLLAQDWDLVHCWEEPYVFAGAEAARWTPKTTAFVFRTAQSLDKRYPPPFNFLERSVLRRSNGWICSGETVEANLMNRAGYGRIPHRRIPLGVDTRRFKPNAEARKQVRLSLGWSMVGPPVVGYSGRFVEAKGLQRLMDGLDGTKTPWRALFIGAGPMEQRLRTWAERHGDSVRIRTDVKHDQVADYLNAMDVMACPSVTTTSWREQFGRMMIEAFAVGLPVLGSDSGEIPYVLDQTGIVVPEQGGDWSEALGSLLESPGQRKRLGDEGRRRALSEFDWSIVGRSHLDFFAEVLGAHSFSELAIPVSA